MPRQSGQQTVPADIKRKILKLKEMARELREGKSFNITRLTSIKSLCQDPEIAFSFVAYLAQLTQNRMNTVENRYLSPERWAEHKAKVHIAMEHLKKYLSDRDEQSKQNLRNAWQDLIDLQNEHRNQSWTTVRVIESSQTVLIEDALECVLKPHECDFLSYHVARQYAQKYNPSYGSGLLPESAPFVEDIIAFWLEWYDLT